MHFARVEHPPWNGRNTPTIPNGNLRELFNGILFPHFSLWNGFLFWELMRMRMSTEGIAFTLLSLSIKLFALPPNHWIKSVTLLKTLLSCFCPISGITAELGKCSSWPILRLSVYEIWNESDGDSKWGNKTLCSEFVFVFLGYWSWESTSLIFKLKNENATHWIQTWMRLNFHQWAISNNVSKVVFLEEYIKFIIFSYRGNKYHYW